MRILYIHQYFTTRAGAAGTRSYEFARRWVAAGHSVDVLTSTAALPPDLRHAAPEGLVDGVRVIAVSSTYRQEMSGRRRLASYAGFALRATLRGRSCAPPDIVFSSSTPLTAGIPGVLLARHFGVPHVFEVRDLWPEAPIQLGYLRSQAAIRGARRLERWIYRHSARVVALSPGMAAGVEAAGVPRHAILTVPNCADLDLFACARAEAEAFKEQHNLSGLVAVYAGSLGTANRILDVIEVARELRRSGSRVTLVVIGTGPDEHRLRAAAEQERLDNVRVLGPRAKTEVVRWIQAADVGLVMFGRWPILETNSPNKFFDYIAARKAVVINTGGWLADLVEREGMGVAVRDGDPVAVARALAELSPAPEAVAAMGVAARRVAERDFDRERLSRVVLTVLAETVPGRPHALAGDGPLINGTRDSGRSRPSGAS